MMNEGEASELLSYITRATFCLEAFEFCLFHFLLAPESKSTISQAERLKPKTKIISRLMCH